MLFGRQSNMVRRTYRANERFLRDKRRQGLDRTTMLEVSKGVRKKRSWISRLIAAVFSREPR